MGEKRAMKVVGKIGDIPQDQEFCKGEDKTSKGMQVVHIERQNPRH